MKTTRLTKEFRLAMLPGIAMMAATMALAADTPPAGDWAVASVLGASKVTVTPSGNAVTVGFAAQGQPPTALRGDVLVGGSSPSGAFTGDLAGRGYSGIRFRINGTGARPAEAAIRLSANGRNWTYRNVTVSATPGEWTLTDVPLRRSAGWTVAIRGDQSDSRLDALWTGDMVVVDAMVVRLLSGGSAVQAYSVSDFRLMGEGVISEPANLSAVQAYFGVGDVDELTAQMKQRDSDGDGMSDYHELLAGFDPYSAASVFAARVAIGATSNEISWDGVLGKAYAVWRSNDLRGGFTVLPGAARIECRATGLMTHTDGAPVGGMPNFYKVVNY